MTPRRLSLLALYRLLGPVDLKNIRRDALLAWVMLFPMLLALLLRYGAPALQEVLQVQLAFDLTPYYPLLMSGYVMTAPSIVGMVTGFLLLDERDARVMTALLVTPLAPRTYLAYRLSAPLLVGFVVTLACYPLAGLTPLPVGDLLAVAGMGALSAPFIALLLVTLAPNKVAGFTLVKLFNLVNLLPTIAYFFEPPVQYLAGVMPTFWPMKMLWLAQAGDGYAAVAAGGLLVNGLVLVLLLWRLQMVMHRTA